MCGASWWVSTRELVEPLAHALARRGAESALVVHGSDGLDEITTTGPTFAARFAGGVVETLTIDAAELGIARARSEQLAGGDAAANARIVAAVLAGALGPQRDLVLVNAAGALWIADAAPDLASGLVLAARSVDSGAARAKLAALVERTQR